MLQALIKKGRVLPTEVPAPLVSSGTVLIKVVNSCVSAGTELSSVYISGKSLIRRALEQPENVKKVLDMFKSDGIAKSYMRVTGKLKAESPIGYSVAGIALAVGEGVMDIQPGDRVAAAGAGIANHAEYVDVPRNLVMRIPEELDFHKASTVTLGGIALQGVRRAKVALGEFVVVFGTGILGQLAVQVLNLSGARVFAVDLDEERLQLAKKMGAEAAFHPKESDPIKAVLHYTGGRGADVVLFCASTTNSQALSDAFAMTRKIGRVVMVGVWGRELRREDIYQKELDFLISTSYGPGRGDENYEQRGLDYPYEYVRWTENRNMEEYLRLLAVNRIQVEPLIQDIYPLGKVENAFRALQAPSRPLMILLDYGVDLSKDFTRLVDTSRNVVNKLTYKPVSRRKIRVGVIGTGTFAVAVHLPNLQKLKDKYEILAVCNRTGYKAKTVAQHFGAKYSTTDYKEILADQNIDLVMICTRHNLHGKMVLESLKSGKHTFVEKPLCITQKELDAIKSFYGFNNVSNKPIGQSTIRPVLMVGFNRRFSKYTQEVKKHIQSRVNPLFIHYRMNAGYVPLDHWVHTEEGGGRIIGEACHIIDLFSCLVDAPVRTYGSVSLQSKTKSVSSHDNKSIVLEYEDGSVATLEYLAIGSKELPKEWLEIHFDEKTIIIEDYRFIRGYGTNIKEIRSKISQKGQLEELVELHRALTNVSQKPESKTWPIELHDMIQTTEITFFTFKPKR